MYHKVICKILLFVLVFSISVSFAQVKDEAILWTLNLGIGQVKNATLDDKIDMWSFNTTVEQVIFMSDISVGANLGWMSTSEVLSVSNDYKTWETYSTTSLLITGKYHFNRTAEWVPYVGLGAGFHVTKVEYAISGFQALENLDGITGSRSIGSLALAGTVGINAIPAKSVFIGLNITPIWMNHTYYKDKLFWMVNLGLGFQFE